MFDPTGLSARTDAINQAFAQFQAEFPAYVTAPLNALGVTSSAQNAFTRVAQTMDKNQSATGSHTLSPGQQTKAILDVTKADLAIIGAALATRAGLGPVTPPVEGDADSGTPSEGSDPSGGSQRVQHATTKDSSEKIMEEEKIKSGSPVVFAEKTDNPGQASGTKEEIMKRTGAEGADKIIEFDVTPGEASKTDEMGDVVLPSPVDLKDRNPTVIDVPEDEDKS